MANIKRLFFDIETSYVLGWFWRASWKTSISTDQILKDSAIICICYKWEGEKQVHSLEWKKGDDSKLIKDFIKVILEADEVVGHNSDKFDLKRFRTRCLMNGVKSLPQFKSIDTLKIVRSNFSFDSNRLDYLGQKMGYGGKIKTDINLWHDIIQRNCKTAMAKMVKYCKRDVDLLEKVYHDVVGYSKPKTNVAVQCGNDKWDCPHCGSIATIVCKHRISAAGFKTVGMQCKDCGKHYSISMKAFNDRTSARLKEAQMLKQY